MTKEEIVRVVDEFINEKGMWQKFKNFLDERGYTPEELGFDDD